MIFVFSDWPLESDQYNTLDYKNWYKQTEGVLGDYTILFRFWCDNNQENIQEFITDFIQKFNVLAERADVDALPPIEVIRESSLVEEEEI